MGSKTILLIRKRENKEKKAEKKSGIGTMDKILVGMAVLIIIFIVTMVVTYWVKGGVPGELIAGVFAMCTGEAGVMGLIQTSKNRIRERKYELEDRVIEQLLEKVKKGDTEQ